MSENMKAVIEKLSVIAPEYNKRTPENWGITFNEYIDGEGEVKNDAYAVGETFISRFSEFGKFEFDKAKPFYSIDQNAFTQPQMIASVTDMAAKIASLEFGQCIRVPIGNLYNFVINNFPYKEDKKRVRIVIKANHGELYGELYGEEVLVLKAAADSEGNAILTHPKLENTIFVPDKTSPIQDFEQGKFYQCIIKTSIKDGTATVAAIARYFKGIEIMLHESPAGFLPEKIEHVNLSCFYDESKILRLPFIEGGDYDFEPVHLSLSLFFDAMCINTIGFEWINLYVNQDCLKPILMVPERPSDEFPVIETVVATVDPRIRGSVF